MSTHYPDVKAKADFVEIEKNILKFWDENKTFEKSVQNRDGAAEFVFYDGPPFANGTPHYGHIMVSYVKDVVARFQTMNGKKVERRLGWDCHGLPAEMPVEKQLGVSGRKEIEAYGIDKFNEACRTDVLKYANIWIDTFKRIGRWVDFEHDYKTMELDFMESVISNFKQLYEKGLVYEDYRVLPYSWAAETPLSNFEVNLGYQDKTDCAITVMFTLENGMKILVWTTTPWTLPSNLMLAVGKDIEYAVMQEKDQKYIIAKALVGKYKKQLENAAEIGTMKGAELVGMSYTPLFDFFLDKKEQGAFKVLAGEFVSTEDGTGVVHIAPGFGQDDFEVCRAYDENFPAVCPVDEAGKFTHEVSGYQGRQVFETNDDIMANLKERGLLVKKDQYTHSYPFCWRTRTPLIYKAMSSWFVKVTDFKDNMVKNNQQINWVPDHIKDGRFGKWLEGARDWSISRNRFWGAPIPVWKSDNPDFPRIDVFGSIAEIFEKTGFEVKDLHRPYIDEVVYPNPDDPSGKSMMRRVADVFDCWFESGSMPYAQVHYPFDNKDWFYNHFPADFIVEAMDQTRGWFYTLMVLSTALHNKPAFKNCICTGLLMAEGGQKLSKSLKNYPDPNLILDTMGSDNMRWFLVSSPVLKGGNLAVDLEGVEIAKAAREALIPLWNAYYFFTLYANAENYQAKEIQLFPSPSMGEATQLSALALSEVVGVENYKQDTTSLSNNLDRYILAKLKKLAADCKTGMETYDVSAATSGITGFMEVLNNWYIRRSRDRFWEGDPQAFDTLYTVLVNLSKIAAPLLPFITEYIYKNLTGQESVHLTDYPSPSMGEASVAQPMAGSNTGRGGTYPESNADEDLIRQMDFVQDLCSAGKYLREEANLRIRLPLASLTVVGNTCHCERSAAISANKSCHPEERSDVGISANLSTDFIDIINIIKDELNVKSVKFDTNLDNYAAKTIYLYTPLLGKTLGKDMGAVMAAYKQGQWTLNEDGTLSIAGFTLTSDLFETRLEIKQGITGRAFDSNRALITLDTVITEELKLEGMARDFVRLVQSLRKDKDFNISDRIELVYHTDNQELTKAIEDNKPYIMEQVLAINITPLSTPTNDLTPGDIEGTQITYNAKVKN